MTCSAACGNAGSLTHWVRPRIKPASSWMLVGFLTHWAAMETLFFFFNTLDFILKKLQRQWKEVIFWKANQFFLYTVALGRSFFKNISIVVVVFCCEPTDKYLRCSFNGSLISKLFLQGLWGRRQSGLGIGAETASWLARSVWWITPSGVFLSHSEGMFNMRNW